MESLPQPVVGPSMARLDRKLDRAPKANEPLSRDVVARKRTSLDLANFLALLGKGRYGERRAKAQALAQKRTSRGCGETKKTTTREPPLWPNPGPFSGPESGPQNGAAFGTFLSKFPKQGWRHCNPISWPRKGYFAIQCGWHGM